MVRTFFDFLWINFKKHIIFATVFYFLFKWFIENLIILLRWMLYLLEKIIINIDKLSLTLMGIQSFMISKEICMFYEIILIRFAFIILIRYLSIYQKIIFVFSIKIFLNKFLAINNFLTLKRKFSLFLLLTLEF